jgi:SAM-dependent methyltransferase
MSSAMWRFAGYGGAGVTVEVQEQLGGVPIQGGYPVKVRASGAVFPGESNATCACNGRIQSADYRGFGRERVMPINFKHHWQGVYRRLRPEKVSWFASHLTVSLALLKRAGINSATRIIDIGAGASTLVDDLLDMGLRHVTVLDISAASLEVARRRLGERADSVQWMVADAAHLELPPLSYDVWHDRAVLHFLTDPKQSAAYAASAAQAIVEGGYAVIGGFAADGPEYCSGLPVARREPEDIAQLFGAAFTLIHAHHERHMTPSGVAQSFAYALLRRATVT